VPHGPHERGALTSRPLTSRPLTDGPLVRTAAAAAAGVGLAAAATGWWALHRRDRARLAADPDADILEAPLPGRGRTVWADDGTPLAVHAAGPVDAPPVVLAHGWGMASRFWVHQVRDLARDHRVIAYDQRGHGSSGTPPTSDHSLDALAGDLHAVLRAAVPDPRRALLVGHSMGAMTIVAWARHRAGRVAEHAHGAVLADTGVDQLHSTFFAELGVARLVADTVGVRALRSRLPVPSRTTPVSARVTRAVACGDEPSPSAVALTEQLFLDCPADVRSAFGATLSDLDLADAVEHLRLPTTVVTGTADRLTPPVHAERLAAALPHAELVELEGAGHQAPLEEPEAFNELLRRRLAAAA
jgi:pimeloyl-ACP methyl ester carboxylesterase